jgi:hypothetical protein
MYVVMRAGPRPDTHLLKNLVRSSRPSDIFASDARELEKACRVVTSQPPLPGLPLFGPLKESSGSPLEKAYWNERNKDGRLRRRGRCSH